MQLELAGSDVEISFGESLSCCQAFSILLRFWPRPMAGQYAPGPYVHMHH